MDLSYFLSGGVTVFADMDNITPLLNLCMYYCIPYTDFCSVEGGVELTFRLHLLKRLKKEVEARGIKIRVVRKRGLPAFLGRYRYRLGMFLGMLIAAVLIFLSESFIWDINVSGNETITTAEIRELLEKEGFFVGCFIPHANTDRIENRILMESDRISWMSINVVGTVANVQIREVESAEDEEDLTRPANLVAAKSGLIEEVRILRGNVVISQGRYVEKGDLLVSGLYDSLQVGIRYTRAQGQVFARTMEEIYIEIPYNYEKKRYTGVEYCDKFLNFFDYSINISKNSGNVGAFYDKINIVENYCLPGGDETPFGVTEVKYSEYEYVTARRTREEAEALAYFDLAERLSVLSRDSILISKTVKPIPLKDSFALLCSVTVIEDIAEVREFEVEIE